MLATAGASRRALTAQRQAVRTATRIPSPEPLEPMIRPALAAVLVLALSACGKAAPESDNPRPDAVPGTSGERPAEAVAEASSAAAGETPAAFNQCKICHTTEPGKNLIGPSLAGVYGRKAGTQAGYPYSPAMRASGLTWDDATLDRFLEAPMKAVPGTRMTYAGLKDAAARKEIIAHLKAL
jgi:cytochrome c